MTTIPVWEVAILTAVVMISAILTGSAFYTAGQRYAKDRARDAAMIQEARERAAATYAIWEGTVQRMGQRLDALEHEYEQYKAATDARLRDMDRGITILTRQLERLNQEPEWKPGDAEMVSVPVNLSALIDRIYQRFNDEELSDLARRIGIGPDDIPGETLQRRATELVEMAQRRGLTGHLITVCKELRPKGKW